MAYSLSTIPAHTEEIREEIQRIQWASLNEVNRIKDLINDRSILPSGDNEDATSKLLSAVDNLVKKTGFSSRRLYTRWKFGAERTELMTDISVRVSNLEAQSAEVRCSQRPIHVVLTLQNRSA
jgi:hypothetical protein